jgi:signal transduction histidine kinase
MIAAPLHPEEDQRLETLLKYEILDSAYERGFDELTTLAAYICGAPISLVSLIDADRQWFKAHHGLDTRETPREQSFCAHAIHSPEQVMVVEDAITDERFHDNPLVTHEPGIRFYAGAPLIATNGMPMGTLCVIDRRPRRLTTEQHQALQMLSRQVVDLLELRIALRRKEEHAKELERLNREKDRFMSLMSHDLKGPIGALLFSMQFVENQVTDAKQRELFRDMTRTTQKVYDLADSLLAWARLQTGKTRVRARQCDLPALLREVIGQLSHVAQQKHIELISHFPAHAEAWADPDMVRAILRNLSSNAIKFTKSGGRVEYRAALADNTLEIRISDTGVGMSEEVRQKLFRIDELYTAWGTDGEEGNGLGLVLCKEFAEQNGGELGLESTLGEGTTVWVRLPIKAPNASRETPTAR